jgi:TRAP-type C4-dicarboxylate transport system substrate-binding protein
MALETGTVDGQENPLNIIRSNKFQEVQKFLSFTDHAYTVSIVSMNLRKFKALTPEQQKILLDAAHEAAVYQRGLNRDQAASDLKTIKDAGTAVNEDVDREALKKAIYEPVKKDYTDQFGTELIEKIEALR